MKTIIVMSAKGGSGKTTAVECLSVEAERMGDGPIWLVDTDKQATLSRWHEKREGDTPQRLETSFQKLPGDLEKLAQRGAAYCFIDTAPTISKQTEDLLVHADLVLIPVRPSPADLWSAAETVDMVKDARKRFLFVISQAKVQASITAQSVAALSAHGQVAETFIADRVLYAAAMTDGRTAPEVASRGPEADEVARLWQNVKTALHTGKKAKKTVMRLVK